MISLTDLVRSLRVGASAAFSCGIALGGIATREFVSEVPWFPPSVTPAKMAFVAVTLMILGAFLFAVSYSVRSVQWLSGLKSPAFLAFHAMAREYRLLEMRSSDLAEIYPVYRKIFGVDLIPQQTVERWMRKNPRIAWKIVRMVEKGRPGRPELVGFFELLPLTKAGVAKLRRDSPNTASLTQDDIHSAIRWSFARAYYIASVGIMDPESIKRPKRRLIERAGAEGIVSKMLFETLLRLAARARIEVYGRPVTEHGLRLAREYGFAQRQIHLPAEQAIWSREIDNDSKIERDRE